MLPPATVPASLLAVLEKLKGCFTTSTFTTFAALVVGLIAQTGRRTVTGMLTGAGLELSWPHDRAHSFFSRAAWDAELVGIVLSHLIARLLIPEGAPLVAAVDDTLVKRSGKEGLRRLLAARRRRQGAPAGRLWHLLRHPGVDRRSAVPRPARVPAGHVPAVAAGQGEDQG